MSEQLPEDRAGFQSELIRARVREQERISRRAFLDHLYDFSMGTITSDLIVNAFSELRGTDKSIFTDLNKLDEVTRERVIAERNGKLLGSAIAIVGCIGGLISARR